MFETKKGNNIQIKSFKSDTKKYDWKVPREWIIKDAFIKDSDGKTILQYKDEPLSVVNYSVPIDTIIDLKKLKKKYTQLKKNPKQYLMLHPIIKKIGVLFTL